MLCQSEFEDYNRVSKPDNAGWFLSQQPLRQCLTRHYKLFQNPLVDLTTPAIPASKSPPTGF
jgi:hypothetical protein